LTAPTTSQATGPHKAESADAEICRVSNVGHSYGTRVALRNVSLTIERRQTVALVGPSGAGKTTLLRLIAGMLQPITGEITLYGLQPAELKDTAERTRLVGMMQQRLDLVSQLSVRHNVEAGMLGRWSTARSLAALFLPLTYQPANAAMDRVGLAGRESERVSRISGGEQQRVAMARLLVQDPQVILADEPVSSLDPALADDLLDLLREISRERGRTIIASLHTPELARTHFDRAIGLRDGSVAFDVPASDLSEELLAAVYRREPAPNLIEQQLESERSSLWSI
jgi:phosphonate transport system ATP-binding protein